MKNKTTAFILTLLGFFGIAGLQYLYLGNVTKFLLWFFTLGIFGLGTLIDIFTIGSAVENNNINIELKTIRTKALQNG